MQKIKNKKYIETVCEHCNNTLDYEVQLSRGHADSIVRVVNYLAKQDNKTYFNLEKELVDQEKILTKTESKNFLLLKHWGFIMPLEQTGCYMVTAKMFAFLKDKTQEYKKCIVIKNGKKGENFGGWFQPELKVTFNQLLSKENPYWEGDFIKYGVVLK